MMSRAQHFFGIAIVLAIAGTLGYAGWKVLRNSQQEVCHASGRPIHPSMRTVAIVGDKLGVYCCPTCALSEGAQMHKPVRFEQVTDYETKHPLRPADAFAVKGSGVIPCLRSGEMVNREGQPVPLDFDRCSPSIIVFSNRAAAERFRAAYGGDVDTFLNLVARTEVSSR
jgi:hypothetical protein